MEEFWKVNSPQNRQLEVTLEAREKLQPPGLRGISHPISMAGQIIFLNCLDLYHTPPDSGKSQYKSRT